MDILSRATVGLQLQNVLTSARLQIEGGFGCHGGELEAQQKVGGGVGEKAEVEVNDSDRRRHTNALYLLSTRE